MKARVIFIFIISLAIFSSHLLAQTDANALIIGNAIQSREGVSKIVYFDSSITYYILVSQLAKKGKIEGYKDTNKVVLQLSKREIKYLDSAFKDTKSISWHYNMFENSVMFSVDSLKIFSDPKKGGLYFQKNYGKKYFIFSKPVFTRNNTLAVFRLAEMFGPAGGNDLLFFYQKKNDKWDQYMYVFAGAW